MRYVGCVDIHQFHVQLQPPPCTLLLQVRLMWPTPRSLPKLLFFLVRYYVLVNAVFALACESHPTCCSILPQETRVDGLPTNMSPEQCKSAFYRVGSKSIRFLSHPCLRSAHCASHMGLCFLRNRICITYRSIFGYLRSQFHPSLSLWDPKVRVRPYPTPTLSLFSDSESSSLPYA